MQHFQYQREENLNPYMGFTSFQHFRGEALYSDVVVRPENHMTETENLECYPIPADVQQNGRSEGFYPDSTLAYFRMLWKEFEPVQGEYHGEVIESILNRAAELGQSVMFRLMPHSTRASEDVPDWLKALIPCPERPDGMRVKDSPTDPRFLELFGTAIRELGKRFDKNPALYSVDICLPGAWGEGHKLENYPDADIQKLVNVFLESFPNTRLIAQIGLPWLVNLCNEKRPVGWRGDGCGDPNHLQNIYPQRVAQLTPDLWKTVPVSFESYWWIGEWQRQGWDIDAIIEKTLAWHVSAFNAKSVPMPLAWKDKIQNWLDRMGYHLSPMQFDCPETARRGEAIPCALVMENRGVAPLYEDIPVKIRLRNAEHTYILDTPLKPIQWLPGIHTERFSIAAPEAGTYAVELGIVGEHTPMIYLATNAQRDGNFYRMGEITIL